MATESAELLFLGEGISKSLGKGTLSKGKSKDKKQGKEQDREQDKGHGKAPENESVCVTNSIVTSKTDLKALQEICRSLVKEKPSLKDYSMSMAEITKGSIDTSQKICLANVGEEVGMSAFAQATIHEGEIILYAGKAIPIQNGDMRKVTKTPYLFSFRDQKGVNRFIVDAEQFRNLAGWIGHLPSRSYVNKNISAESSQKIETANFEQIWVWVTDYDILLPVYIAIREIEPKEFLGVDYNTDLYWTVRNVFPRYMEKFGKLIPKEEVRYNRFTVNFSHPDLDLTFSKTMTLQEVEKDFPLQREPANRFKFMYEDSQKIMLILEQPAFELLNQKKGLPNVNIEAQGYLTIPMIQQVARLSAEVLGQVFKAHLHPIHPFLIDMKNDNYTVIYNCKLPHKVFNAARDNLRARHLAQHFKCLLFKEKGVCSFLCGDRNSYTFTINIIECYELAKKYRQYRGQSEKVQYLNSFVGEAPYPMPDTEPDTVSGTQDNSIRKRTAKRSA